MARTRTSLSHKFLVLVHPRLYRLGLARRMLGAPVLILKTRGRRSDRLIETPLMYFEDDSDLFLIASKGGSPQHPAWYLNLVGQPEVEARVGNSQKDFHAEPVADVAERDRLYAKAAAIYKGYADYEKKTERKIPVVRLTPKQA